MPSEGDEWNDPAAVTEDEPMENPPPVGGFLLSLLAVGYSGYLLWVDEYLLMLLALLAGMALYLGVVTIAAAREDSL